VTQIDAVFVDSHESGRLDVALVISPQFDDAPAVLKFISCDLSGRPPDTIPFDENKFNLLKADLAPYGVTDQMLTERLGRIKLLCVSRPNWGTYQIETSSGRVDTFQPGPTSPFVVDSSRRVVGQLVRTPAASSTNQDIGVWLFYWIFI